MELEHIQDALNEHEIHYEARHHPEDLTEDQIEDFEQDFRTRLDSVKTELSRLEDELEDALRELREALPKCLDCDEPLDEDNRHDQYTSFCADCGEEQETG